MSEQSTRSSRLCKGWSSPIRGDGSLWWNEEGVPQWELLGKPSGYQQQVWLPVGPRESTVPSERVWNLSAEDTYLEEKVRAHICLSDQGKTVPAWECSGSSSAVLSRPCTFAWPWSLVSRDLLVERNVQSLEDCRGHWEEFCSLKEKQCCGRMEW